MLLLFKGIIAYSNLNWTGLDFSYCVHLCTRCEQLQCNCLCHPLNFTSENVLDSHTFCCLGMQLSKRSFFALLPINFLVPLENWAWKNFFWYFIQVRINIIQRWRRINNVKSLIKIIGSIFSLVYKWLLDFINICTGL